MDIVTALIDRMQHKTVNEEAALWLCIIWAFIIVIQQERVAERGWHMGN
jgi:hypothetical protein